MKTFYKRKRISCPVLDPYRNHTILIVASIICYARYCLQIIGCKKFFTLQSLCKPGKFCLLLAEGSKLKIKSYLQRFLLKVTPFLQIVFIILLDMKMSDLRGVFFIKAIKMITTKESQQSPKFALTKLQGKITLKNHLIKLQVGASSNTGASLVGLRLI